MNNESVGKQIVEALKKQAESMDIQEEATELFAEPEVESKSADLFGANDDIFASGSYLVYAQGR